MPSVLTFTQPLNVSLQVGDTAYYVPTSTSGGYSINSSSVVEIGVVTNITGLVVTVGTQINNPPNGAYILFSKDNKANLSSALGYYAEVKFKNSSTTTSELFSVGIDTFESSK
jgi:hypothetical protein|tara:strand:+ start:7521 stop:7859 length:339 start_codon:yes stop_codon:yes gene_type:complete